MKVFTMMGTGQIARLLFEVVEAHNFQGLVFEHFLSEPGIAVLNHLAQLRKSAEDFMLILVIPPPSFDQNGMIRGKLYTYVFLNQHAGKQSNGVSGGATPEIIAGLNPLVDRFSLMTYDFSQGSPSGGKARSEMSC